MGDPIWFCDVILRDAKAKKDYKIKDTLVSGNHKDRIWNYPLYRERLVREVFTTPPDTRKRWRTKTCSSSTSITRSKSGTVISTVGSLSESLISTFLIFATCQNAPNHIG